MNNEIYDLIVESYEMGDITLEEAQILSEACSKKAIAIGAGAAAALGGAAAGGAALYNKRKKEKERLKAEMDKIEEEKKKEEEKALNKEINIANSAKRDLTYKDVRQARLKNKIDEVNDNMAARRNTRERDTVNTNELKRGLNKRTRQDDYELMDVKRELDKKIADDLYQTKDMERKSRLEDAKNELELQKINVEIQKVMKQIQSENISTPKRESLKNKLKKLLKKKDEMTNK